MLRRYLGTDQLTPIEKLLYIFLGAALGVASVATILVLWGSMMLGLLLALVAVLLWCLSLLCWLFAPMRLVCFFAGHVRAGTGDARDNFCGHCGDVHED